MQSDTQTTTESGAHGSNGLSRQASAVAKKPKKRGGAAKRKAKASSRKSSPGKAKIAAGKTYALVARLGAEVYRKAWAKVRKLDKGRKPGSDRVSMSSWLTSVIARAAK